MFDKAVELLRVGSASRHYPERALKSARRKKQFASQPVRWHHLPHEALSLEIGSRINLREANHTDLDVALQYLRDRLEWLELAEHDDYINCVAAELT